MTGAYVLAEGNVFQNINQVVQSPIQGQAFTSPDPNTNAVCSQYLGRACQRNGYGSSGTFDFVDEGFLVKFKGKNVAAAVGYEEVIKSVPGTAGQGKI